MDWRNRTLPASEGINAQAWQMKAIPKKAIPRTRTISGFPMKLREPAINTAYERTERLCNQKRPLSSCI